MAAVGTKTSKVPTEVRLLFQFLFRAFYRIQKLSGELFASTMNGSYNREIEYRAKERMFSFVAINNDIFCCVEICQQA